MGADPGIRPLFIDVIIGRLVSSSIPFRFWRPGNCDSCASRSRSEAAFGGVMSLTSYFRHWRTDSTPRLRIQIAPADS